MSSVRNLSLAEQAKLVLSLTDLTTLQDDDTHERVQGLCAKATGDIGHTAAVCVYPQFVATAKEATAGTDVTVATVVNFPKSTESLDATLELTKQAIAAKVDEVDLVFPFAGYLATVAKSGEVCLQSGMVTNLEQLDEVAFQYVKAVADICHAHNVKLKVILESGVLVHPQLIARASDISVRAGADFIKTSTGKTPVSATLAAAKVMLTACKNSNGSCGFKASGGISTVAQAVEYLALAEEICGPEFLVPGKFRFGASGIYNDIHSILTTGASTTTKSTGY